MNSSSKKKLIFNFNKRVLSASRLPRTANICTSTKIFDFDSSMHYRVIWCKISEEYFRLKKFQEWLKLKIIDVFWYIHWLPQQESRHHTYIQSRSRYNLTCFFFNMFFLFYCYKTRENISHVVKLLSALPCLEIFPSRRPTDTINLEIRWNPYLLIKNLSC